MHPTMPLQTHHPQPAHAAHAGPATTQAGSSSSIRTCKGLAACPQGHLPRMEHHHINPALHLPLVAHLRNRGRQEAGQLSDIHRSSLAVASSACWLAAGKAGQRARQAGAPVQHPPAGGEPCQRRPGCGTGSARPASPSPRLQVAHKQYTQRMQTQLLHQQSPTAKALRAAPSGPASGPQARAGQLNQNRAPKLNPKENAPTMARCASLRSSMRYHSMRCRPSASSSFSWLHSGGSGGGTGGEQ